MSCFLAPSQPWVSRTEGPRRIWGWDSGAVRVLGDINANTRKLIQRSSPSCAVSRLVSQIIKQSIIELKLQAEDSFVLKVVQLEELLQVRHSVFVIGNAGSGKSQACHQRLPPIRPPCRPEPPPNSHSGGVSWHCLGLWWTLEGGT